MSGSQLTSATSLSLHFVISFRACVFVHFGYSHLRAVVRHWCRDCNLTVQFAAGGEESHGSQQLQQCRYHSSLFRDAAGIFPLA